MNPVDEYLASKEKTALKMPNVNLQEAGRLATVGAAFAGGLGVQKGVAKVYRAITKKRDFDHMMQSNPDLEEYRAQNPSQFNQHYTSLRRMNPEFASEPTVAGTYMRQMSMNPGSAGKVIVESLRGRTPDMSMKDISTGMGMLAGVAPQQPRAADVLKEEKAKDELESMGVQYP